MFDALLHLLFGFVYFLGKNLGRMNFNADTLVPGVIAYGLVILLLHWKFRQLCLRSGRSWSVRSSFIVGLLLPALFGISVLVPGVMFLLRELVSGR